MGTLVKGMLIIHVIFATLALLSGALAIILKSNTPKHKPVGRIYFWSMTVVFITATFISLVKNLQFLFLIGVFTYYATLIAYRALKLKNLHQGQKPHAVDWIIEAIAGLSFLSMVIFAVVVYFQSGTAQAIIPFVFGSIGVWGVYRNVSGFIKGPNETLYWLKKHIGNMCGSYIGAITAFTVNQSSHIPLNPIILWLGPTAIITPIIVFELKKLKSKPL
jgi:uncharacterized membrane protein